MDTWVRVEECGEMGGLRSLHALQVDLQMRLSNQQSPLRHTVQEALTAVEAIADKWTHSIARGTNLQTSIDGLPLPARVELLLKVLKENRGAERTLVFTKLRATAHFLCSVLSSSTELSSLNPLVVVGHGGWDGMTWEGHEGQQDALE